MFNEFKVLFQSFVVLVTALIVWIGQLISKLNNFIDNDGVATGLMRWPRPVAFTLLVLLFTVGWFHPVTLLAFAQGISALPQQFWDVVYIVLGSIASSKVLREAGGILGKSNNKDDSK